MSTALQDGETQKEKGSSLYAALARTTTRGLALYFSRPVRLFRPSKVSGWTFLRGLASREGVSLSPQYLSSLAKRQGIFFLPKHFISPMAINAVLGTVLWTSYAQASSFLEAYVPGHSAAIIAVSGGFAGGVQALVAAPAENVRLVLGGGSSHSGWSGAWRDVFLGTQSAQAAAKGQSRQDARRVKIWMKEVNGMAGRGWHGWGWGCFKDICGFAVFFSMFEMTRQTSASLKRQSAQISDSDLMPEVWRDCPLKSYTPRVVHSLALVSGSVLAGLAYEVVGRPWDIARRTIHLRKVSASTRAATSKTSVSSIQALSEKLRLEGVKSFFRPADVPSDAEALRNGNRGTGMLGCAVRTLARVGPWGVGFLVWETFGPGLDM